MNTAPRPRDGEVHLYTMALPQQSAELARLDGFLSPSERERARLLKSRAVGNRSIAVRGILREILGGYLGIEPGNVRIATGKHGKPFVEQNCGDLRFNLSHAGDIFVLAVAAGLEVGIDIETIEPDKPLNDMARIAFSRREQEELFSLPSHHLKTAAFYRCWVRKEACMKACGRGFSLPSNSFEIPLLHEEAALLNICCNQTCWHVLDIDVPHRYCAALAVETRPSAMHPPAVKRYYRGRKTVAESPDFIPEK